MLEFQSEWNLLSSCITLAKLTVLTSQDPTMSHYTQFEFELTRHLKVETTRSVCFYSCITLQSWICVLKR
jgi:hypothetical protein